jgi:hypothetical protein
LENPIGHRKLKDDLECSSLSIDGLNAGLEDHDKEEWAKRQLIYWKRCNHDRKQVLNRAAESADYDIRILFRKLVPLTMGFLRIII